MKQLNRLLRCYVNVLQFHWKYWKSVPDPIVGMMSGLDLINSCHMGSLMLHAGKTEHSQRVPSSNVEEWTLFLLWQLGL